jgi:AcrR family transcriptional regulator
MARSVSRSVSKPQLVEAALRAASNLGKDVADVPVAAIASEAGTSRSTLLRRFGGSRTALNDAVLAAGVDPGGLPPVRVRAVAAAGSLISESGLAATTLEAVAVRASCSVYSLHAVFGGRDELMHAVFERYSPIADVEEYLARPAGDLPELVRGFYRTLARALGREPRVAPAIFAEAFSRPTSPAVQSLAAYGVPRMFGVLNRWLEAEITARRIRDLPRPLLAQQLLGPMMVHLLTRPALTNVLAFSLPDIDTVCDTFAEAFVRAVAQSSSATMPAT